MIFDAIAEQTKGSAVETKLILPTGYGACGGLVFAQGKQRKEFLSCSLRCGSI